MCVTGNGVLVRGLAATAVGADPASASDAAGDIG